MQTLPGVATVEIDANNRTATVSGKPEAFVVADAVEALKKCGFPADKTEELSGS